MNNNRSIQIIITCLIVGTITFALRQNKPCCQCAIQDKTIFDIDSNVSSTHQNNEKKQTKDESVIVIEPDISSKDLSYKHGFFSYSPTSISLTINDKEIEVNNHDPITVKIDSNNMVTTRCKYKFIAGYEGEKTSMWKVKPGEKHTVTFNWKSPEKIKIEGAELSSITGQDKGGDNKDDDNDDDEDASVDSDTTLAAAQKTIQPPTATTVKEHVAQQEEKKSSLVAVKKENTPTHSKKSA